MERPNWFLLWIRKPVDHWIKCVDNQSGNAQKVGKNMTNRCVIIWSKLGVKVPNCLMRPDVIKILIIHVIHFITLILRIQISLGLVLWFGNLIQFRRYSEFIRPLPKLVYHTLRLLLTFVWSQLNVLNHSHTSVIFISLCTATCFGCNCKPASGLL
jgi:hypothetical protein